MGHDATPRAQLLGKNPRERRKEGAPAGAGRAFAAGAPMTIEFTSSAVTIAETGKVVIACIDGDVVVTLLECSRVAALDLAARITDELSRPPIPPTEPGSFDAG